MTATIAQAKRIEIWPVDRLVPYARNARTHSDGQVAKIAAAITQFGFTNPILVDSKDGILAGHGRLQAARTLGLQEVPVIVLDHLSDTQRRAYIIADNKLAEESGWDVTLLEQELRDLDMEGFDLEATGFTDEEITHLLGDGLIPDSIEPRVDPVATQASAERVEAEEKAEQARGSLAEQFGAPPFSVLDTRQGYWQARRDRWLAITGDLTETKEGVLAEDSLMSDINNGSSNFDPVLAELMMKWFCKPGGKVLDPFGGEQTKGVVAGVLGLQYHASEFRQDQVNVNRAVCAKYPHVNYVCGDSEFIDQTITERGFDLCFTSPPYYDLEVYSKEDMSALGTYEEFMAKYTAIFRKCVAMLADNAFLVIKIGEIRDKKTGVYRNFVGDNIAMFKALGLKYYNEIVLLNSFGTAPQRAGRMFGTRKMVKVHQNVLVFYKGEQAKAVENCGEMRGAVVEELAPSAPADAGDASDVLYVQD